MVARRKFSLPIAALISLVCLTPAKPAAAQTNPPNIIFILADDLGWTDINCRDVYGSLGEKYQTNEPNTVAEQYDSQVYSTPNLMRLRKMGMRFTNAYTAAPICVPTRGSIVTGKYPWRWNGGQLPNGPDPDAIVTIAEALSQVNNNYISAFMGKWHLSALRNDDSVKYNDPEKQGFGIQFTGDGESSTHYKWVMGGRGGQYQASNFLSEPRNFNPPDYTDYIKNLFPSEDRSDVYTSDPHTHYCEHLDDCLREESIEFMEEMLSNGTPFFLYLSNYLVHSSGPDYPNSGRDLGLEAKPQYLLDMESQWCNGPETHWPLDEGSGTTIDDDFNTSGEYYGELNGVSWDDSDPAPRDDVLQFHGGTDNVVLKKVNTAGCLAGSNYTGIVGSHPRTVTAWIKPDTGVASNAVLIAWGSGDLDTTATCMTDDLDNQNGKQWIIRLEEYKLHVDVGGGSITGNTQLSDPDTWYHIAVVFNPNTSFDTDEITLYVDGSMEESPSCSLLTEAFIHTSDVEPVRFGYRPDDVGFKGYMDDVRIYGRALEETDISALSNNTHVTFGGGLSGRPLQHPEYIDSYYDIIDAAGNFITQPEGHRNYTYAAMIKNLDDNVGKILDYLEDPSDDGTGPGKDDDSILNDTIIIFYSDNGGEQDNSSQYIWNEDQSNPDSVRIDSDSKRTHITDNYPLRQGKVSLYEGGTRVPLMVCWPNGGIPQNSICDTPVNSIDIMPTILDLAGKQNLQMFIADNEIDGVSLKPLLLPACGETFVRPYGNALVTYSYGQIRTHRNKDFCNTWNINSADPFTHKSGTAADDVLAIRQGNYKLIYYTTCGVSSELYDLSTDMGEIHDLASEKPGVALELESRLRSIFEHTEYSTQCGQQNWFSAAYNNDEKTWHNTINSAIIAATDGDEIIVFHRTYQENVNIEKDITLRSAVPGDPAAVTATLIKGKITIGSSSSVTCALEGVTVANDSGNGIDCGIDNHVTIRHCRIVDHDTAIGISCGTGVNLTLMNSVLYNNTTAVSLGQGNTGACVNNTIVDNAIGIDYTETGTCSVALHNNIIWYSGAGTTLSGTFSNVTHNCIKFNTHSGNGNIDSDPDFVDSVNRDYHLLADSSCIDAGDNSEAGSICFDIDGEPRIQKGRIDMGVDEWLPFMHQWTLDDGAGQVATDTAGTEPGFLRNFPTDDSQWVDGQSGDPFDTALLFDGSDDTVEMTDFKGVTGKQARTVTAWIKAPQPHWGGIVAWGDESDGHWWVLNVRPDVPGTPPGALQVGLFNGKAIGSTDVCDGAWHHVAAVLDPADPANPQATDIRLYVDGRVDPISSATTNFAIDTFATNDVELGIVNGYYLQGALDDVRIYDRVLNIAEIEELAGGPVLHWKLDEKSGLTVSDATDNHYFGTLNGDPHYSTWRPLDGMIGGALRFDGMDDSVMANCYKGVTGKQARTVAAWIKTPQPHWGGIVGWGDESNGHWWFFYVRPDVPGTDTTPGALQVGLYNGRAIGSTNVCDGVWHHVAAVLDPADPANPRATDIRLYVDGKADEIDEVTPNFAIDTGATNDVVMGIVNGQYLKGALDDVRIYDRSLSDSEIQRLAGSLLAHWKLDETTGLTAFDATDNAHNGTLFDFPLDDSQWVPGQDGGALEFDGEDDYMDISNTDEFFNPAALGDFSVFAWVKLKVPNGTAGQFIFQQLDGVGTGRSLLYRVGSSSTDADKLACHLGGLAHYYSTNIVFDDAIPTWHHVGFTYDDLNGMTGTLTLYVDGQPAGSFSNVPAESSTGDLRIGASKDLNLPGSHEFWSGPIDDVRIYDRALTHSEIFQLAVDPPVAYWRFDENCGIMAFDSAGDNDAMLQPTGSEPTWYTEGMVNGSLNFENNDYVTIADSSLSGAFPSASGAGSNTTADAFSISFWMSADNFNTRRGLISKQSDPNRGFVITLETDQKVHYECWPTGAGSATTVVSQTTLNAHEFYHIVITHTDDDYVKMYLNGVWDEEDDALPVPRANGQDLDIGRYYWNGTNSWYHDGLIDEVQFYNFALSADQVEAIYDIQSLAVNPYGTYTPQAHWKLDESCGDMAADAAGKNGLLLANSPTWDDDGGQIDGALGFDGSDDYGTIVDSDLDGSFPSQNSGAASDFTIAAWIQIGVDDDRLPIASKESVNDRGFVFDVDSGKLRLQSYNTTTENTIVVSDSNDYLVVDTWRHVAVTYEDGSDTAILYIDGDAVETQTSYGGAPRSNDEDLEIGRYYWNSSYSAYFDGVLDDVRFYDVVLPESAIEKLAGQ